MSDRPFDHEAALAMAEWVHRDEPPHRVRVLGIQRIARMLYEYAFETIEERRARRRRMIRAVERMLRTETVMPHAEFDAREDEIVAWLHANVGMRRGQHLLHVALKGSTKNGDPGTWEDGQWGDNTYVWFVRKVDAAKFILMFGATPTGYDEERRAKLIEWASSQ